MKISVNWMKQFGGQGLDGSVDELVKKIGAQLGAVEEVTDLGNRYKDILVAKVVTCEDHPDAERLHVCKIDDGKKAENVERDDEGYIQVVCGASNVREGLMVAWLPPGSTVPSSVGKDPFVLEARSLRGIVSNGMLASAKELAIGDDHDGILEIDKEASPGVLFAEVYELNDYIIDIENKMFTHRPDCFGQLGVAREIAGIHGQKFVSPEWYLNVLKDVLEPDSTDVLPLEVRNEIPGFVPRFMAVALSNIQVKPSPIWLQTYLMRVGIRPINNVVDITNYMMMLSGQPLHAYDYDKVRAKDGDTGKATLIARYPMSGEKVKLLNGKEIEPRNEAIVISSATKPIGLGGVMGGSDTEVDNNTKNVILECATFDMYSIRRTAMAHGLFTDAVTRFNKGQSPLQNDRVMAKSVEMLRESAGAKVASKVIDSDNTASKNSAVQLSTDFVNVRLGLNLSVDEMKTLLENVEFKVATTDNDLVVTAPFWRTDIDIPEDLVEEIGRLYGFDHLNLELPKRDLSPVEKDITLELKAKVRDILSRAGANEALTYTFVHGNLLDKVDQDKGQAFQLSNALSPNLQYYRISLMPSLLENVHPNIKSGYDKFALFELNKTHDLSHVDDDNGLPSEFNILAFVITQNSKGVSSESGVSYYDARLYLDFLASELGFTLEYKPITEEAGYPIVKPYDYLRSAYVSVKETGKFLGIIGEFKSSVNKNLKLPQTTAGFEIDIDELIKSLGQKQLYHALPRFPSITQDICLKVSASLNFVELFNLVYHSVNDVKPKNTYVLINPVDIYMADNNQDHKQITLRIKVANYDKTMREEEVSEILNKVADRAKEQFGAERV